MDMLQELKIESGTKAELLRRTRNLSLPHAVILETKDAALAEETACAIAAGLVCTAEEQARPCGVCAACKKVTAGSHPDVFTARGGEAARSFHVETIRQVRVDSVILPNEARCKVYVLCNAQSMSEQAQNALLKVLEEPPRYVRFLLTCDDRAHLLATIRSRAVSYALDHGAPAVSSEAAQEAALAIARCVAQGSELDLMRETARFEKDKTLLRETLRTLLQVFRGALMCKSGAQTDETAQDVRLLAGALSQQRLVALIQATRELLVCTDRNANNNLIITRLSSTLRRAAGR